MVQSCQESRARALGIKFEARQTFLWEHNAEAIPEGKGGCIQAQLVLLEHLPAGQLQGKAGAVPCTTKSEEGCSKCCTKVELHQLHPFPTTRNLKRLEVHGSTPQMRSYFGSDVL